MRDDPGRAGNLDPCRRGGSAELQENVHTAEAGERALPPSGGNVAANHAARPLFPVTTWNLRNLYQGTKLLQKTRVRTDRPAHGQAPLIYPVDSVFTKRQFRRYAMTRHSNQYLIYSATALARRHSAEVAISRHESLHPGHVGFSDNGRPGQTGKRLWACEPWHAAYRESQLQSYASGHPWISPSGTPRT